MRMYIPRFRWVAAGAVFTATLLAAGCSTSSRCVNSSSAVEPHPAVPVAVPQPTAAAVEPWTDEARGPTSAVSVFGEFNGVARSLGAPGGDISIQQHTACEDGYDADVVADPSGKWLAFTSTRHSERADIYLQRVDGASVIQLTSDPAEDIHPAFSPDGRRLAFCSTRSGNWDIYLMDADGKNVEQVTSTTAQEAHPSFSPDGTRLVYCSLSPRSDQWELWVVNLSTHERQMIGHGLFPCWSPSREVDRIAFQRSRQRGSRWFSLWTVDLVEGEPTRLTEVVASANAAIVSPAWSPDGSRLAFTTILTPARSEGGRPAGRHDIWTVSSDGTGRQRLTQGDGMNLGPTWAVDNRIYFISDRAGHENVWSIRADGAKTAVAGEPGHGALQQPEENNPDHAAAPPAVPAAVGASDLREAHQ